MVGPERTAIRLCAALDARTQALQITLLRAPTERHDLDRHRPTCSQHGRALAAIDHDQLACAGLSDDLLPQQRSAPALDQVQLGVHFVRTVDGQVDAWHVVRGDQQNAEPTRVGFRGAGARHAHDIEQLALLDQLRQLLQCEERGAARAESHDHARAHEAHGMLGSSTFVVIGVGHGTRGFPALQYAVRSNARAATAHLAGSFATDPSRTCRVCVAATLRSSSITFDESSEPSSVDSAMPRATCSGLSTVT